MALRTGGRVSRIGLGAMSLSLAGRPDRERAKAVIRRAVELGVTLIDTADAYAIDDDETGHNERLVAEALRDMGLVVAGTDAPVLVATKGGMTRPAGRWHRNGSPEHLRRACEASLRALGVERIGLYQFHSPDPRVPFPDSVGTLARLQEEGKIDAVGLSNVTVDHIVVAETIVRVASVQNAGSAWDVGYRRSPVIDHCDRHGILFLAYEPLGGGSRAASLGASPAVAAVSAELGATPQELALAWLIHEAPIVVPIPGATRVETITSSVRAASIRLDDSTRRRLVKAFRTLPGSRSLARRLLDRAGRMLRQ